MLSPKDELIAEAERNARNLNALAEAGILQRCEIHDQVYGNANPTREELEAAATAAGMTADAADDLHEAIRAGPAKCPGCSEPDF